MALKTASILLVLLGLGVVTALCAWLGAGAVFGAAVSVGASGLGLLAAAQLAIDGLLAAAWTTACPGLGYPRLLAARLVREGATTCLPFFQLGGMLIGIRATCFPGNGPGERRCRAVSWPEASAANVVDVTVELVAQVGFVLLGLLFLLDRRPDASFRGPVALGGLLLLGAALLFAWAQRRASDTFRRALGALGRHVAGQWRDALQDGVDALQDALNRFYAGPVRLLLASLLHLSAWSAGAGGTLLAYRLLGASSVSLGDAVAIEGVASGVLSVSFLVPAALGVQETAYVALGALFGVDSHLSLGLSLLRRARDLVIGVPVLLIWQARELRRLRSGEMPSTLIATPDDQII